jgi:hypothetical protein
MWSDFKGLLASAYNMVLIAMIVGFFYFSIKYYDMFSKISVGIIKMFTNNPNYISFANSIVTVFTIFAVVILYNGAKKR